VGRDQGISEDQLLALRDHAASESFTDLEKRVLDYAAALSATPAQATDAMVSALRKDLDDEQLVELTAMIAWENFRARFNRGFDVADQGFSKGAYCVLPERHPAIAAPSESR
jgi:4-carboxymuconolactone decarboxylase